GRDALVDRGRRPLPGPGHAGRRGGRGAARVDRRDRPGRQPRRGAPARRGGPGAGDDRGVLLPPGGVGGASLRPSRPAVGGRGRAGAPALRVRPEGPGTVAGPAGAPAAPRPPAARHLDAAPRPLTGGAGAPRWTGQLAPMRMPSRAPPHWTAFSSVKLSSPHRPSSRPLPDCLYPPKGTLMLKDGPLTSTCPVRSRPATATARSTDADQTAPCSP